MLTREGRYECVRCVVGLHLLLVERISSCRLGGAPKVHEELHGQRKWMKEWRQVGRHLQAMEGERGDRIS